jgi:predicted DNA binding CopG/RHH family protein
MASEFVVPAFATEAEEAEWWDSHREELSDEFERAGKEGRLRIGTVKKMAIAAEMGLRLTRDEVHKANDLAAQKGLTFQEYINQVVHEALQRETAA